MLSFKPFLLLHSSFTSLQENKKNTFTFTFLLTLSLSFGHFLLYLVILSYIGLFSLKFGYSLFLFGPSLLFWFCNLRNTNFPSCLEQGRPQTSKVSFLSNWGKVIQGFFLCTLWEFATMCNNVQQCAKMCNNVQKCSGENGALSIIHPPLLMGTILCTENSRHCSTSSFFWLQKEKLLKFQSEILFAPM